MPKNAIFLKQKCKNYLSVGGSASQTPVGLLLLTIASLSSLFVEPNTFYYPQRRTK